MIPDPSQVAHRWLRARTRIVSKVLRGMSREIYIDAVWDMYESVYRTIGMSIKTPQGLLEYPVWDLILAGGQPVTFIFYKVKPYGLKVGLLGHDGSSTGKAHAVKGLRTKFRQNGIYGEVSHKVKAIVLASGAPVVCAVYASQVLGKPIAVDDDDPLSYSRTLKGVGAVTKTLVGLPKGIPTTKANNPSCPAIQPQPTIPELSPRLAAELDAEDLDAHMAEIALVASLGL